MRVLPAFVALAISIHALREEGDTSMVSGYVEPLISIHALREEGDAQHLHIHPPRSRISIHALREEGDPARSISDTSWSYFYPRPPRGGRHFRTLIHEIK